MSLVFIATSASAQLTNPAESDSIKDYKRTFDIYIGIGPALGSFGDLRAQNPEFLNEPSDIMPYLFFNLNFGNPSKIIVSIPVNAGYSKSSNPAFFTNLPGYNVVSLPVNYGVFIGHRFYSSSHFFVKGITGSVGIMQAEASVLCYQGYNNTVQQTMACAEIKFDLFSFYGKERHAASKTMDMHAFNFNNISFKLGYCFPVSQAEWATRTDLTTPSKTQVIGPYMAIGYDFGAHYKRKMLTE